jgi:phage shock protein A
MFNLLKRIWFVIIGKGNAAVSSVEAENMEHLLELRVKEANDGLVRAQAGVAQSFAAVAEAEDQLKKLREEETRIVARFTALDRANNPKANDSALAVQKLRGDITGWENRLQLAKTTAEQNQKALTAARKKLQDNVAEARRNIQESRINKQLANALEVATGLITETSGSTYELNRIQEMARQQNNTQKGRIMASQGQLEASGLLDAEAEEQVLKEDAAAALRAELNLSPKTKAPAAPDTASGGTPITEPGAKPGM